MTDIGVRRYGRLSDADVAGVLALMEAASDADGVYPLSEHVVLHLRHGGEEPAVHLIVRDEGGAVVGYAHVDTTDVVDGASAELAVHPAHRQRGYGRRLVEGAIAVSEECTPGRLRLWAHGDHPAAGKLAATVGFERWRVLWQMRRSLHSPVPAPQFAPGVWLRPFRPGADEAGWLELNRRAFADHPEQGRWTRHDLEIREQESWFDPNGFLLAETDGGLVGFHWTKVHGADRHGHDPIGEVYVLGVDPSAQGTGLGVALTLAGLRLLRGRGLSQAMLYVDEANTKAIRLYEKLGFVRWTTDVSYRLSG